MRFEAGDVYPVYSSLRSDPLGTKAFYDSLDVMKGMSAKRNYRTVNKLEESGPATIIYPGIRTGSIRHMDKDKIIFLERMLMNGSRLVILAYPEKKEHDISQKKIMDKDKGSIEDPKSAEKDYGETPDEKCRERRSQAVSLPERWGFDFSYHEVFDEKERAIRSSGLTVSLPGSVSWHSALFFQNLNNAWKDVYNVEGRPVIIERRFGKGSIVISTDTYFISNEALRKERHPAALAWLIGNNRSVVFDERHFGLHENPGVAALARKYRLHGVLAGVLLLGALFIWKNSVSLVPPYDDTADSDSDVSTGKDSMSGFIGLLRRNIPPRNLLQVCFHEWKRTYAHKAKDSQDEMRQIQTIIESEGRRGKQQSIVNAYKMTNKILMERKRK
jgi:hypothetical protein